VRILVIGGTRFIGAATVRRLSQLGHEIIVLHRGQSEGDLPDSVQHIRDAGLSLIGRERFAAYREAFRLFAPAVALDMLLMLENDAKITMETLKGIAGRIVVVSSGDVYRAYGRLIGTEPGSPVPTPVSEESPLREKLYPYRHDTPSGNWVDDYDKIPVEDIVMGDAAMPGTILRLPMVYGPNDQQHRLYQYVKRMVDGRPAILLDDLTAQWKTMRGYVEDVAHAIALAVTDDRAAGEIYNVAEQEPLAEADWVRRIAKVAGWNGKVVIAPTAKLPAAMQPQLNLRQHLTMDSGRIRRQLGYEEQTPPDVALERTIAWEKANPPAKINPEDFDYTAEDAVLATL
jgi:nucleoside-diphosphate-sugar epimerase